MASQLYFDASKLPPTKAQFVCWLDVMGAREAMAQSLHRSANFIEKLHAAVLRHPKQSVRIYPIMDGAYITSESQDDLLGFLGAVFTDLAYSFATTEEPLHRFLARAAIAFGPVIHGVDVPEEASRELYGNQRHRESLLFGIPMIQAYQGEHHAPPFGVFLHESVRSFAPTRDRPLSGLWWRWHTYYPPGFLDKFRAQLREHYEWCLRSTYSLGYAEDRVRVHKKMAYEYFEICQAAT